MSQKQTFTVNDALAIQKEHLAQWKCILKPEIFELLEAYAFGRNSILNEKSDPYNVFRGTDIDQFVHNLMNTKRNQEIKSKS